MNKSRSTVDKRVSQLPSWLWSNSNVLPSMYRKIWETVREDRPVLGVNNQGEYLVDTKKVFPLLLTSQLPTEVLGYIWGLANQKYAGKLTEQELYVVLALVAVAQTSYPFTNLEVLHLLPGPPSPRLNLTLIYPNVSQIPSPQDQIVLPDNFGKIHDHQAKSLHKTSSVSSGIAGSVLPGLVLNHSHMGETKIDSKSQITAASLPKGSMETILESRQINFNQTESRGAHSSSSLDSNDDFSEFQSAPIPQTLPNIPMWDSKQGSAIGSRLANHNLAVKKPSEKPKKIASSSTSGSSTNNNKNHSVSQIRPIPTAASTVCLVPNSQIISSSSSKELLPPPERLGELFPKCSLKNQAKTVILKDTAIRNNDTPKQIVTNTVKESTNVALEKIEIPPPTRTIPEKLISTATKDSDNSLQDLMNLQQVEDKYSALRVLVEEPSIVQPILDVNAIVPPTVSSQSDDFGDFVSAEQPEIITASSTNFLGSSSMNNDNSNDLFNDFERFRPQAKKATDNSLIIEATREAFSNLEINASPEGQSDQKYDGIVETEKVAQREDTISVNSIELGNGTIGVLTRSSSVPSLDLKSFLSPTVEDEQQQVENMHQLIYWEWKQYMECCVLLIQTAANAFSSITSDAVLQEVLASAQGYNFLCNLAEVAAVCRRVNFSHREMDINIMGFDDLLIDIDRIWADMEPFYANIPIVTELPVWPLHQADNAICCALCLTVVTSGRVVHNDNNYHVTCANLWLNCVNSNLPALRYPPSSASMLSHSTASSSGISQI